MYREGGFDDAITRDSARATNHRGIFRSASEKLGGVVRFFKQTVFEGRTVEKMAGNYTEAIIRQNNGDKDWPRDLTSGGRRLSDFSSKGLKPYDPILDKPAL